MKTRFAAILVLVFRTSGAQTMPASKLTWEQFFEQTQFDVRHEAPRASEIGACHARVTTPDSIALTRDVGQSISLWGTRSGTGDWYPLGDREMIPVQDTLRARVLSTDCNFLGEMSLVLQDKSYFLRLSANTILVPSPDGRRLPGVAIVYVIAANGHLEPAMLSHEKCDTCVFTFTSAAPFLDSLAREEARTAEFQTMRGKQKAAAAKRSEALEAAVERLHGVGSSDQRIAEIRAKHWSDAITRAVIARMIFLGMTREQVLASWGEPNDIHRTVTPDDVHEQWVYGSQYVYLDNGIVTAWQD